jgi:hypothetical protein
MMDAQKATAGAVPCKASRLYDPGDGAHRDFGDGAIATCFVLDGSHRAARVPVFRAVCQLCDGPAPLGRPPKQDDGQPLKQRG